VFPEITFPESETVPPMVLFVALLSTRTPASALWREASPSAVVPM
jgi:hypothetical protein